MKIIIVIIAAVLVYLLGFFLGRVKERVLVELKEKPNDRIKHTKQMCVKCEDSEKGEKIEEYISEGWRFVTTTQYVDGKSFLFLRKKYCRCDTTAFVSCGGISLYFSRHIL